MYSHLAYRQGAPPSRAPGHGRLQSHDHCVGSRPTKARRASRVLRSNSHAPTRNGPRCLPDGGPARFRRCPVPNATRPAGYRAPSPAVPARQPAPARSGAARPPRPAAENSRHALAVQPHSLSLAASRSDAYSRSVSSMVKRGSPLCVALFLPHKTLVHQGRQTIQWIQTNPQGRADRLSSLDGPAAGKHAQPGKSACSSSLSRS